VRVTDAAGPAGRGRAVASRRGAILERRLLRDGRVEHVPAGGAERLVEAEFVAPLSGEGPFAVEVLVDGRVRARASVSVGATGGRILVLEGVADHGAAGSGT
jgi:hypothetical protein